jgi:hypothetical protein
LKNSEGKIVKIEVRGTREYNNCFFSVKDIANGFSMENLKKTILKKNRGYTEIQDYLFFMVNSNPKKYHNKYRKKLFFTYMGFRIMIDVSRSMKYHPNINTLHLWLSQFDGNQKPDKFVINTDAQKQLATIGHVYCATSPYINTIKIGVWTKTKDGLKQRLQTYYGKDVEIFWHLTMFPFVLEKQCHSHFKQYNLSGELFQDCHMDEYLEFIRENHTKPSDDAKKLFDDYLNEIFRE